MTDFSDEYYNSVLEEYESEQEMAEHLVYLKIPYETFSIQGVPHVFTGGRLYRKIKSGEIYSRSAEDVLSNASMMGNVSDYFDIDFEQKFNDDFWSYPPILYHGTKDVQGVMKRGLEPRSEVRGLNNHDVGDAVFATTERSIAEEYAEDGLIAIDTRAMKAAKCMPFVSEEPEVAEQELLSALASRFGLEWNIEYGDPGIDPDTVILYRKIPKKYLKAI